MSKNSPILPTHAEVIASAAQATRMVHGAVERSPFQETAEALYLNSGFVYDNAEAAEAAFDGTTPRYVYSRFRNPTVKVFEDRLALLEGAEACRATATGMAAVFASIACTIRRGERVVAAKALFGSCTWILADLLPRWGVETVFVDGGDLEAWAAALSHPTAVVLLETPSNPGLDLIDLKAVSELAHAAGARVIVDNVFATPILQSPLQQGADVVVYSATKHIDGQGRTLGGAILGSEDYINNTLSPFLRHTGPMLSPFNAWVLLKGLETLDLRVNKASASALAVATFLESRPEIARVRYPGLASHPQKALADRQMKSGGPLVGFDVAGGKKAAFQLLNALRVIRISNNLGDSKSLACHPWTTTHQSRTPEEKVAQGFDERLIRLSVGLEDPSDLIADLGRALDSIKV